MNSNKKKTLHLLQPYLTEDEIDDLIDMWHNNILKHRKLRDALGITEHQYSLFVSVASSPKFKIPRNKKNSKNLLKKR